MNIKKDNKGFTLVEIVIVLAIAALILAAILFAVRGAQQSRRDSARRDAGGQIGALMEEYAGNHNGTYPTDNADVSAAIAGRTESPLTGNDYTLDSFTNSVGTCPAVATDHVALAVNNRTWQVCVGLESGDVFRASNQ